MTSIRKFVYAALLAATSVSFAPAVASAQEAHGKFTLAHDVLWEKTRVPAGEYQFVVEPNGITPVLMLTKITTPRAGFILLVPTTEDSKRSDVNRLVLETTPEGSYVKAMQLPEFGMTLDFNVPRATEKQLAKAGVTGSAPAQ